MGAQRRKRRPRKRSAATGERRAALSAQRERSAKQDVATTGPEARVQRHSDTVQRHSGTVQRQSGTDGERPPSPFGGLPISEVMILAGLVALIVWLVRGGTPTLIAGIAACTLGVLEVTAREHFSGFRSHATLLAAIPALAVGIGITSAIGTRRDRAPLLLLIGGAIFAVLFRLLRRRFQVARQARVARPPMP